MRLPGLPNQPVEDISRGAAEAGAVAGSVIQQATREVAEGLAAYGAELTKTQAMRAEARLAGGLASVEASLDKPYLTVAEIREAIGEQGMASISPGAQAYVNGKADDDLVPTWAVGSEVFAARSRRVREDAAREMDWSPGAKRGFEFAASRETLARQQKLGARYVQEQHNYQVGAQTASLMSILETARSPEEFDRARMMISSSAVLPPDAKQKLTEKAQEFQDTTPIYDALRSQSVAEMEMQLGQVHDLAQKTSLNAAQRREYAEALRAGIDRVRRSSQPPDPKVQQRQVAEAVWDSLTADFDKRAKARGGYTRAQADALFGSIVPPSSGSVGSDEWRAMRSWVESHTLKPGGAGAPKAETPGQRNAQFLLEADMTDNPEKYLNMTPGEFLGVTERLGLSPQGRDESGRRFNTLRAGANRADPNAPLAEHIEETVLTLGREAGVFPKKGPKGFSLKNSASWGDQKTPLGTPMADIYQAITKKLRDERAKYVRKEGRPPPAGYLEGIAAKDLARVRVTSKGLIWDSTEETAAIDAETVGRPSYPVMPKEEEAKIREALRATGAEETDENIRRLWEASHTPPISSAPQGPDPLASLTPDEDALAGVSLVN